LLIPFTWLFVPLLFPRGRRVLFGVAILLGGVLVVGPLTIRNALVFRHFVPLSLGAGQTMLEGIGDYDQARRFGIPNTDIEIMREEANASGRPEYAQTLFGPEGVSRERLRLARAFRVIREHPFWFAGVMVRRGLSMLRLDRAPVIRRHPAVVHPLTELEMRAALKTIPAAELLAMSPGASTRLIDTTQLLELSGDNSKYGVQLESVPVRVRSNTEYVFTVPIRMKQGRLLIEVTDASGQRTYEDRFVDTLHGVGVDEQPTRNQYLPFVSLAEHEIKLRIKNGGSRGVGEIGTVALFELGPASQTWIRFPRFVLGTLQRVFVTAVMLPLAIFGLAVLIYFRCWRTIAVLLNVPAYYIVVQSTLHTEYRYVLALHYFLFVFVATSVWFVGNRLWRRLTSFST
jgi:hypothetical protein